MRATRTQLRAICPVCFGLWACEPGMSQHGYTVKFGFFAGGCPGYGRPHFGTEAGKAVAIENLARLREWIASDKARAAAVRAGTSPVMRNKRVGIYSVPEVFPNPSPREIEDYARHIESEVRHAESHADSMAKRIAAWVPADPVEVVVEKSGPVVHLRAKRGGYSMQACSSRISGAGRTTEVKSEVTCSRCLARIAEIEKREADRRNVNLDRDGKPIPPLDNEPDREKAAKVARRYDPKYW